ncbi:MAG: tyrosine-type recombinase/integrase [Deltaproteobacteria bacterium]|nr:tyrosine-type recombinase/integrase [Deltaproteobacteria bacterium]
MSVMQRKWRDPKTGALRKSWMIDVTVRMPDGSRSPRVRMAAPVQTRRDAEIFERKVRNEIENGTYGKKPEKKLAPTLREFAPKVLEAAEANRLKPSTIEAKKLILEGRLMRMFGDKRLDQFDELDIQRIKAEMKERNSKTVNNVLCVLNGTLKLAVKLKEISALPVHIELLKVELRDMDFYEFGQYTDLVEAAGKIDRRTVAMVLLGGDAGLRLGEILALEWTDVDFKRRQLRIQRGEWRGKVSLPKGGRGRKIPMTKALTAALEDLRHLRGPRVFYRDDGTPMSQQTLKSWMAQAQRRANLEVTAGLHILRHTFCSHLAMRAVAPVTIKELAGHKSLSTTMRYMHLSPSEKDRAIAMLDDRPVESISETHGTCMAHEVVFEDNPRQLLRP